MPLTAKVVKDRPVSGDFKAVIYTNAPPHDPGNYIRINYGARVCAAIAEFRRSEQSSDQATISVDKYFRDFLKVRTGDLVDIDSYQPQNAERITLLISQAWAISDQESRDIKDILIGKPVCRGQVFPKSTWGGGQHEITISTIDPDGIGLIANDDTQISFESERHLNGNKHVITWADIGGLDKDIKLIRRLIEYPLRNERAFSYFGVGAPRGVLLYGPPGTGKTLIAKALKTETGASIHIISGPEIVSPFQGKSEEVLRKKFEDARANAPAIILIDEIDSLLPRRDMLRSEASHGLVATMLTLMDGLNDMQGVIVIGTTNRLGEIDLAFRRPGRLEYEIMIGAPDKAGRKKILEIQTRNMPLSEKDDKGKLNKVLESLADATPGYTGADIASLCREAGRCALFRYFTDEQLSSGHMLPDPKMVVLATDFLEAMKNVQPSAMRSTMVEDVPDDITFDKIGGLTEIKKLLGDSILPDIAPGDIPSLVKPAKGVLLYGASGVGKTMIARATANKCGARLITLRGPEIHRKWFGESEEIIRSTFAKAREVAPCIILLDEIDSLAPVRGGSGTQAIESITSQVINELESIRSAERVCVIATSNQPDLIDPALRRPGRLDMEIRVDKPNQQERKEIFAIHLKGVQLDKDVDLDKLAEQAHGSSGGSFSGADIAECCRRAARQAWDVAGKDKSKFIITLPQLTEAIEQVRKTNRVKLGEKGKLGFGLP